MHKTQRKQIEVCIQGSEYPINPKRDQQVLDRLLCEYQNQYETIHTTGRWTMLLHDCRFKTTAAVAVLFLAIGGLWFSSTQQVWALEQVLTALEEVQSIHIQGHLLYGRDYESMPFDLWMQAPDEEADSLRLHFKCRKRIYVLEGDLAYECWPEEGVAKIRKGSELKEFKYFYDMATLSPWFTGKMLKVLKQVVTDWQQNISIDSDTGEEEITVSCRYVPTHMIYRMVIDPDTKLVSEATLWSPDLMDKPCVTTSLIEYNQKIPPGTFALPQHTQVEYNGEIPLDKLTLPEGSEFIDRQATKQAISLFNQAKPLFQQKETCQQAIELYQEVCDTYPYPKQDDYVAYAQMMIGLCHRKLGQPQQEIEAYEKAIHAGIAHFTKGDLSYFLGRAYMEQGLETKALEAFENCLHDCQGEKDPEQSAYQAAQERIAEIKSRNP